MAAVLSIGSSLIDIFVHSDEFHLEQSTAGLLLCQQYGEKIEVSDFALHTGGGGSNTAVGFARLGHSVRCISELGRDAWADIVTRDLEAEHVNTELMVREKKEQTGGSVILVAADGGRTVLVHRGAASQLDPADVPTPAINDTEWVHISSISGKIETLQHIFAIRLAANKQAVSWNPGSAELAALADGRLPVSVLAVQVLLLNRQEWEAISNVHTAVLQKIPEIIITDGGAGGQLFISGTQSSFSVERVTSVDDTGAGDAFATGYVAARIEGIEPLAAINWAKLSSRSVVQHVGAKPGLLTKSALEQALTLMS